MKLKKDTRIKTVELFRRGRPKRIYVRDKIKENINRSEGKKAKWKVLEEEE